MTAPSPSPDEAAASPSPDEATSPPDESVRPLERGLAVLRAMAADPSPRQRAGDLARETGLARSTVDRVATTLTRLGHLRSDGRDLMLTPRLMEFGNAYLASCGLPEALAPHASALADRLDESVSIAVPDEDGVRFITQAPRRRTMAVSFRIGDLLPAERCAPGALFATGWTEAERERRLTRRRTDPLDSRFPAAPKRTGAEDDREVEADFEDRVRAAREAGLSVDDQLIEPGLVAVALPVRGPSGATVCAVSVVSHTSRHTAPSLVEHALPHLRATVDAMEQTLRSQASTPPPPTDAVATFDSSLKEELGSGFLQSLARGLDVLRALGSRRGTMSLADTARATGLPRATARRALITLQHLGYAAAEPDGYRLLPRVMDLGFPRLSQLTFAQIARPHLAALVEQVHESASVAVLDGDDVRYVARVTASRIMRVDITVGTRFPAYATSMGRVLLAALPEQERLDHLSRVTPRRFTPHSRTTVPALSHALATAARDGWALVDQELEEGLCSLAAPVTDNLGRVIAAANVALHTSRGTPARIRDTVLPPLQEAARRIGDDLAVVSRFTGSRLR
ncbi:IclR family transcriptional regulator C-terminal domain-containing protein [Kitasatospora misakiensis]|uniref:IclR family transcriptional regulator C-terminal domain-containing protein n=1 Tax=Kitasatospora misakiensis TaxID=67330 RepID=A0ABW0X616_9ACTN